MSSPPAVSAPQATNITTTTSSSHLLQLQDQQGQQPSAGDPAATNNSPRVWFISSGCSPLVVRLIRRLLAHGDYVAACLSPHELEDPHRSAEFRAVVAECQTDRQDRAGWKDRLRSIKTDGRSMGQCGAAVAEVIDVFGRIDIVLCCNSEAIIGTVEELAASETARNLVHDQFETIFFSQVNLIKACLPTLRNQHNGHIMILTSIGGHIGTPGMSIYTAATWAIEGFCDSLAYEIAPFNIRLTIVQPHKEIQSLTNRIVFSPELPPGPPTQQQQSNPGHPDSDAHSSSQHAHQHLTVPSVRSMYTRVLNLDPETALPSPPNEDDDEEGDDDADDDDNDNDNAMLDSPSIAPPTLSPSISQSSISSPTHHLRISNTPPQPSHPATTTAPPPPPPPPRSHSQAQTSTTAGEGGTPSISSPPPPPPQEQQPSSTSPNQNKIIYRYPRLPESSLDSLCNETVTALAAIGGHENPPARHIVGFEGAEAVKEKLRTVTEELEDFVEASIAVDIVEDRDDGGVGASSGGGGGGQGGGSVAGGGGAGSVVDDGSVGRVSAAGGGGGGDGSSYVDGDVQMDWDGGQLWQ